MKKGIIEAMALLDEPVYMTDHIKMPPLSFEGYCRSLGLFHPWQIELVKQVGASPTVLYGSLLGRDPKAWPVHVALPSELRGRLVYLKDQFDKLRIPLTRGGP